MPVMDAVSVPAAPFTVTTGVGLVVVVPLAAGNVPADVSTRARWPSSVMIACAWSDALRSMLPSVYVEAVCPAITTPLRSHR